jgi:hypothetical protein
MSDGCDSALTGGPFELFVGGGRLVRKKEKKAKKAKKDIDGSADGG